MKHLPQGLRQVFNLKAEHPVSIKTAEVGTKSSLRVDVQLHCNNTTLNTSALLDSGCDAFAIMHPRLVKVLGLEEIPLPNPLLIQLVNDAQAPEMAFFRTPSIQTLIDGKLWESKIWFIIWDIGERDLILGHPWLAKHNPDIDWNKKSLTPRPKSDEQLPRLLPQEHLNFKLPDKIPKEYKSYAKVFNTDLAKRLPPSRGEFAFPINLVEGKAFPKSHRIYHLSRDEMNLLREKVDEGLTNGTMRRSKATDAAPVMFVAQDGKKRMCVDLRAKNDCIEPDGYRPPHLKAMVKDMAGKTWYTKLDLKAAYHQIRVKAEDVPKTAFICPLGTFESLVMWEGWKTAVGHFQRFMDDKSAGLKDLWVYLDDIGIATDGTLEEHRQAVAAALKMLMENDLYCNSAKCLFDQPHIPFGGFMVGREGVNILEKSREEVEDLPRPTNLKSVQAFLGLAQQFHPWMPRYDEVVKPIQDLCSKNVKFEWGDYQEQAFQHVKKIIMSAEILKPADLSRPFVMYTDASPFGLGAVLMQRNSDDGFLHPIEFWSRKLQNAERNYTINDKELMAIVDGLKHWRHWLSNTLVAIKVRTDHKNLVYYTKRRRLTPRHARWALDLAEFNFIIEHVPGTYNKTADTLSRNPVFAPTNEEVRDDHDQILLPVEFFLPRPSYAARPTNGSSILDYPDKVQINAIQVEAKSQIFVGLVELGQKIRKWVSDEGEKLEILKTRHDCPTAGHLGIDKTIELIRRDFDWTNLRDDVTKYVKSCDSCQRNKVERASPRGELRPLPIPNVPWSHISIDFITQLPKSMHLGQTYDAIAVVVDRLTKMAHFIFCNSDITAEETAQLYIDFVYKLHGLPVDLVSDRGPQFISSFWKTFWRLLSAKASLSTAFHPQTDGQTERTNQTLEQYLRHFVNYEQNDWAQYLSLAEFAYNNAIHSSTKTSPFFANYMRHPRADTLSKEKVESSSDSAEQKVQRMDELLEKLKQHLIKAQAAMVIQANKHRRPADFKVNDKVWVLTRNMQSPRPARKLDYRKSGPYVIEEQINSVSFKLKLPPHMHVHPVFHSSLLSPHHENYFSNRIPTPPPPIQYRDQDGPEFEVERILDVRKRGRRWEWLVNWKGYGIGDRTWEPWTNLGRAKESVLKFHNVHPLKPAPAFIKEQMIE